MFELPVFLVNLNIPYLLALLAILIGLGILVLPREWGLLLVWGAALGYTAWRYYLAPNPGLLVFATTITIWAVLGFTAERWGKRFERGRWIDPQTLWGAVIGSIVGLFLFQGMAALMIGMFIGGAIPEFKHGFQAAMRTGISVFFAILGYPGFCLMLALVIAGQFIQQSF